ncbi:MAG: hypothetical protein ACXV2B_05205 [Halobacteriota archaeon]
MKWIALIAILLRALSIKTAGTGSAIVRQNAKASKATKLPASATQQKGSSPIYQFDMMVGAKVIGKIKVDAKNGADHF